MSYIPQFIDFVYSRLIVTHCSLKNFILFLQSRNQLINELTNYIVYLIAILLNLVVVLQRASITYDSKTIDALKCVKRVSHLLMQSSSSINCLSPRALEKKSVTNISPAFG